MAAGISGLAYALPKGVLDHADLQERFGCEEMDRLIKTTGIKSRRVASDTECASDLALKAAEELLKESDVDPNSIDFLIFATQMPDYLMPTTACILQNKLGIPTTAGALDVNLGCSQYVYSHSLAYALVTSQLAKRVLVLTGDTPSRIVNPLDRAVVPLFGDAGTAAIVEEVGEGVGFQSFYYGSDGQEHEALIWPSSGMRLKKTSATATEIEDKHGSVRSADDMYMDGQKIFLFTMKTVPKTLRAFLEREGLEVDDIDFFVFHQASGLIVDTIVKKLKIPPEKVNHVYQERGNSGGSTVGIALHHALKDGRIRPGSKVVLSAFGVGLSWAHSMMIWPERNVASYAIE